MQTQLPARLQAIADNETPFVVCKMGEHELRCYWKGSSVLGVLWGAYDKERSTCLVSYHSTSGGGYSKEDHILALLFKDAKLKPKGMDLGSEGVPWEYKVGGNFYNVPKSAIRKVK
jgi:hypothetical protein|tara:strand:+ start:60 stop:407 length:348 start_codon:yes stop_codon:yes gene_type:complete